MKLGLWAGLWAGAAALAGSFACSSDAQNGATSSGGAAGSAGVGVFSGAGGGGAGNAGVTNNACPEQPTPRHAQGSVVSFSLGLVMAGKPFVFGQPNMLADGGSLVPLNLRFYISELLLLRNSGEEPIAVDLVTDGGRPAPYGVHLFNAEDGASSKLHVLAPAGQYSGLSFALGIKLSCNQQTPANLTDPLTDTSQMTWPHTSGFLFFRYEGRYTAGSAGASGASSAAEIPPMVHMGGDIAKELVPRVTVLGALSVPASGTLERSLSVVMDEIFKGATSNIDVSDVSVGLLSSAEAQAGERLRRGLPELKTFVLEP